MNLKKAGKVLTVIVAVVTLLAVIYIMINRIGLQDELDFGAGAYYYADIPEFEKYEKSVGYKARLPYVVYVILFLAWGALMYKVWKKLDKLICRFANALPAVRSRQFPFLRGSTSGRIRSSRPESGTVPSLSGPVPPAENRIWSLTRLCCTTTLMPD